MSHRHDVSTVPSLAPRPKPASELSTPGRGPGDRRILPPSTEATGTSVSAHTHADQKEANAVCGRPQRRATLVLSPRPGTPCLTLAAGSVRGCSL